jgi:hypothetical protein
MKRAILIVFAVLVVAVAGGIYFIWSSMDAIVKAAVEEVGSEVTGTGVTIADVKITPTDGKGTLRGFRMTNPHGFAEGEALKFDEVSLTIDPTTIFDDTVVIEEILIVGLRVTYAIGEGTSNLVEIQENVDDYIGEDDGGASGDEGGPNMVIQNLTFRNGTVSVNMPGLIDEGLSADLPDIQLTDIGKDGKGATPGDVAEEVIDAVIAAALEAVSTLDLDDVVKGVEDVATEAEKALDDAAGEAEKAIDGLLK